MSDNNGKFIKIAKKIKYFSTLTPPSFFNQH